MSDYEDDVKRQPTGPLTERELQEIRYGFELDRAGRLYRRRAVLWFKYVGAGIATAVAATQLPDGIAKVVKLLLGK